jgi:Thiol-disulfide isomerase and thioredoxins
MKKLLIFGGIIIVLFAALAIVTNLQNKQKAEGNPYKKSSLHPETVKLLDDPNYQNIILPDELETKLNNQEDVIVYFFSSTCPHCKNTTPILMPLAKELNVDIYQYNLLEFEEGWDEYKIDATPTLVHYVNGKEADRIVGSQEKSIFREALENWTKSK